MLRNLLLNKEWKHEKRAIIVLLIGLISMFSVHFLSQKNMKQSAIDDKKLNRDHTLNTKIAIIEKHLFSMENNMQNFVFSRNKDFYKQFKQEIIKADQQFKEMEEILRLNSPQLHDAFSSFQKSVDRIIQFNIELIDGFLFNEKSRIEVSIQQQQKVKLYKTLRLAIVNFQQSEHINVEQRRINAIKSAQNTLFYENIGFILSAILLLLSLVYLMQSLRKRMKLHEQLLQEKEKVEYSAQIKEQFLANMSHEIRTPLQAILGFTNILAKEPLNERQKQYVTTIQSASENLLTIINDILDVSKIESGMIRLEDIPFSINGLLHSIDSMFQPRVLKKGIELKLHPNPSVPDILIGDPTRLTQILVNLINNAIKFTDKGRIDIFTTIIDKNTSDLRLKISVKDTGIGIDQKKLTQIFDRFEQADSKVTRIYGGSGLGLFIVKQLTEILGGKVSVESKTGKGSLFSVEIPYRIADEKDMHRVIESGLIHFNTNFEDIKMLLVEDNLMNQRVIGLFLSEWGVDYDLAENGKTAIQQLENKQYDLVLMDIQMPEMDGYSTTEYIRQEMQLKTPIIAMTAHAMAGEREKALSYGMNEYIPKPIREEDLFRLISRFIPLVRGENTITDEFKQVVSEKPQNTEITIDYNFLIQSSKGKKGYLKSILDLFLQQMPIEIKALEDALQNENFIQISKIAHSLKSTVGYAGLDHSIRPFLEILEKQAKENPTVEQITPLFIDLKKVLEIAIEKIKTEAMPLVEKNSF